jgi:hypothetical protein
MEVISLQESKRLTQLEVIIKNGQETFVAVGSALAEIRDKKLYRSDYPTFAHYCEDVWGWSDSRARQICIAAETAKALPMVTNERSARALSKVPPPRRQGIVEKIIGAGQKVTAAAIAKVSALPPRKTIAKTLDATGLEVPAEALGFYKRKDEAQVLLSMVSDLRGILRRAQEEKDPLFAEVDFTDSLAKLNQVYLDLQRAKPYAVCPTCNGVKPDKCEVCSGRGFVSEFYWKNCVPAETKQLTGRK